MTSNCTEKPDYHWDLTASMDVVFAACTGALLILTVKQLQAYLHTIDSNPNRCPVTLFIYWTSIFTEVSIFTMMIMEAVDRFQGKRSRNSTASFDIFASFGLLDLGNFQALTMMALNCKLYAKIDLLGGKSIEEVSNHDVTLRRWFHSTLALNLLGFVCALSLCIYVNMNETMADAWLNEKRIVLIIVALYSLITLIYLIYSCISLFSTLNKLFENNVPADFTSLRRCFLVTAAIFGVFILYCIVYGFMANVACEMYLMSTFNDFITVGCLAGIVLTNLHVFYEFNMCHRAAPKEPTSDAVLSEDLQKDSLVQVEDSESEIEEIEYKAEYLTNFELWEQMNHLNTGQFSTLFRSLGKSFYYKKEEEEENYL